MAKTDDRIAKSNRSGQFNDTTGLICIEINFLETQLSMIFLNLNQLNCSNLSV